MKFKDYRKKRYLTLTFEIEDVDKLPLKYRKQILSIALAQGIAVRVIRQAVSVGVREIEGVKIFEDFDINIKAN